MERDPVEAILAVRCPEHTSDPGVPCVKMMWLSGEQPVFCEARIRAALAMPRGEAAWAAEAVALLRRVTTTTHGPGGETTALDALVDDICSLIGAYDRRTHTGVAFDKALASATEAIRGMGNGRFSKQDTRTAERSEGVTRESHAGTPRACETCGGTGKVNGKMDAFNPSGHKHPCPTCTGGR